MPHFKLLITVNSDETASSASFRRSLGKNSHDVLASELSLEFLRPF